MINRSKSLGRWRSLGNSWAKRMADSGRSLHFVLIASFLSCMGVLLLFVLLMLVPKLSALLEKNAIERTKETVMQSVHTENVYVDQMLSTLY